MTETQPTNDLDIAVIGISCVFPQANTIEQFWDNLCNKIETIQFFSDEELLSKGVDPQLLQNPNYVKAASTLEHIEDFDADFFGINPNEARATDPQHRLFLECCWTALEDAGYDPELFDGDIGVFAGLGMNSYLLDVLGRHESFWETTSQEQMIIGNDKDFLPMRVSYKLNLTGPSINVNTACSTSLVALHLARQSLLLGESDMALVGGVSISLFTNKGYLYVKDSIQSPDGHCRAFDAQAQGTIWGDGSGVVVLKRLSDALSDGDHIYAVVKSSAVNNDGSRKVGYTAPSVDGQSNVIVEALAIAGLSAEQIGYVETHGTGTPLGDPIEIAALTQAFRTDTEKIGFCPIGSVKTNIGHLNAAAGIAGFIKAVLSLHHKKLPPSLHFTTPNPKIDFAHSPFYVQTELTEWKNNSGPLRAGISSMGIGGTNCHVIAEEAPSIAKVQNIPYDNSKQLLLLSARSAQALEDITDNLALHLDTHPEISLADVAYTLQCGRRALPYRRAVICHTLEEAAQMLYQRDPASLLDSQFLYAIDFSLPHEPELEKWLRGEIVDWEALWADKTPRRLPLPTYPFERKRYWYEQKSMIQVKEPASTKKPTDESDYFKKQDEIADWFYVPLWNQAPLPFLAPKLSLRRHLIFVDQGQIGDMVAQKLQMQGDTTILVTAGACYKQNNTLSFTLQPSDPDGYVQLLKTLRNTDSLPESILFFWALQAPDKQALSMDRDILVAEQEKGFFSALHFSQALSTVMPNDALKFTVFTNNVFDITGSEELNIHASTLGGLCLVLQQTYSNLTCRIVDIVLPLIHQAKHLEEILNEINSDTLELMCAYRGGKRYRRTYAPLRVEADASRATTLQKEKVYLVYSGLDGLGYQVSEHIARVKGAKLLIFEEEHFPSRENWTAWIEEHEKDDATSIRIQNALNLLNYGAEYVGSLSRQSEENAQLLSNIEAQFGRVAGIIHTPGSSNVRRISALKYANPESWGKHFDAVVYSLLLLDQMFEGKTLDFRIMANSLGAVLGGDGFIHVSTVGNYTKAYLTMKNRNREQAWTVQCWDFWAVEWVSARRSNLPAAILERMVPSVLTTEEGLQCFEQAFAAKSLTELDISATNLIQRYRKWVELSDLREAASEENEGTVVYARPELTTPYVAAQSSLEQDLAILFTRLLGIENVGINDDFFELGGHSLLGVQLAAEIRKTYAIDIEPHFLYRLSTIAGLVSYIEMQVALSS